jgi:transcriptional regulator with XRE-family HTH domain
MLKVDLIGEVRARRRLPQAPLARAIREAAGISQGRLAEELGVGRVTVTRWEGGQRQPRGSTAAAYAELLDQLKRAVR